MPFAGWKLRELRRRRALTLRQLGALAGLGHDTIHALEVGQHQPRPSTLRKLADALGVDPAVFFTEVFEDQGKVAA